MGDVVILGGGQAGASAAARLRAKGHQGAITLIGAEPVPPYQRPPLSKAYLLGEMAAQRLYLRPESFYADKEITLRLGQPVDGVDTSSARVHLGGEAIPYDDLIFATGATPRQLPDAVTEGRDGIYTLRSLADVDAMQPEFRQGARVLVLGGGYIGLEAAAVASKLGLAVTVIEAAPRILGRVAAPQTADYFRKLHRSHGVDLREGVSLESLSGEGRVSGAVLSDGTELAVDFVLVGIGIAPEASLAARSGLELAENGIAVDAHGRASAPGIWAAGDCAAFPFRGRTIRLESVQNAIDQAECVADNICGADAPYECVPWFWSDQYDVKLQTAGLNTGWDRVTIRDGGAARSHFYWQGETLLAVDSMNDPRMHMVAKRLIAAGRSPDPAAAVDPAADPKSLLG